MSKPVPPAPEQYEAFSGEKQVGYVRLRRGYFRVDCPDAGAETVIREEYDDGLTGAFEDQSDRRLYLDKAKEAIKAWCELQSATEAVN